MFEEILAAVAAKTPLVHCITNYVTVNDVANILLACGGSPIMADDEKEVEEITSICGGLVLNIGTLNARTIEAMKKAGRRANALSHPVVLDPVGAGASALRTKTAHTLLETVKFAVIRGNSSEIKTLAGLDASTRGVDASEADAAGGQLEEAAAFARAFAAKTGAVIAMTGAVDILADPQKAYAIRNGHPMMSRITGTGCMLTAVVCAFCAAFPENPLEATAAAVCAMGLCGEQAARVSNGGTGGMRIALIDAISRMDAKTLTEGAKLETI